MPPSPSSRCSPSRERKMINAHKRGRSLESAMPFKAKDDDLALFNDMHTRERDNFLLHTSDDFEDSISKLRYFSDFKIGIRIPVRGESSNLLNTEGEKDDYNWLFTPPDTPLFSSLDDDERRPANLLPRGRPRSQPVAVSRSLTSEKTHRTSRSSASPHRLSPSPRSNSSLAQLRGRPSSAPRSSTPPILRPRTPSPRPSTPPSKPSTPSPRSSTPTLRVTRTGLSGAASSSGIRGVSPVKATRGNSASPKLRGWQASLDGFPADAPPNLRTSLSDRPPSGTRGSSPASRNGRETSSKFGRQSMSPTPSRSASSSRSHERDQSSTYSKGSIVSSGDDDADSLNSMTVGIAQSLTARKNGASVNNKAITFSKKPLRTVSASSAPKRPFDYALRQMDHRKTPQNMFRPLLSSVPTTTFYGGKSSSMQRHVLSRNSSLTTSSNTSSEQGASAPPETESSDQEPVADEWQRAQQTETQEEIFIFDKVEEINEDDCHDIRSGNPQNNDQTVYTSTSCKVVPHEFKNSLDKSGNAISATASLDSYSPHNQSVLACYEAVATCSKCRKIFHTMEVNENTSFCAECIEKDRYFPAGDPGTTLLEKAKGTDGFCSDLPINSSVPTLSEMGAADILGPHEGKNKHVTDSMPNNYPLQLVIDHMDQETNAIHNISDNMFDQSQHRGPPSIRVDSPEGTGISVLKLQVLSSNNQPFVQGRNFSATNILCTEPSYARDNMSAIKHSFGRDSTSASSSIDLGSLKQKEDCVHHHLGNERCEVDKIARDADANSHITSSRYEVSIDSQGAAYNTKSESEENFSVSMEAVEYEAFRETVVVTEEQRHALETANLNPTQSSLIGQAVDVDISCHAARCSNTSESQSSSQPENFCLQNASIGNLNDEDCSSCVSDDEFLSEHSDKNVYDRKVPNEIMGSSVVGENHVVNDIHQPDDKYNDATKSSCDVILEPDSDQNFEEIQAELILSQIPSDSEAFHERSVSSTSENALLDSKSLSIEHACGIQEEPTVTIEGPRGRMSRSLTLEEATDAILFCSSIIHDLAYKAANIGMENELMLLEGSRPTVTLLGNSISKQKEPRKFSDRNTPKAHKYKRKKLETNAKVTEFGDALRVEEPKTANEDIHTKPDSLKPPKLDSKCNCTIM